MLLSLVLSISTAGTTVFWQDSGFFLAAVKDLGVLYPPGFVLYLILAKFWTWMLFFVDFTLAVHLFSSFSGAIAAGLLSMAVREFLASNGPLFRRGDAVSGDLADVVAAATGCLWASGYTVWLSGIMAKGYAFHYLILSALLLALVRADARRRPRDFTLVAALIGLAWQAHPSSALAGIAFLLFLAIHGRSLGWKGIAWRTGLAASCALGPALLLPILATRDSMASFGAPRTPPDLLEYLTGGRFLSREGAFGWESSRWRDLATFFWEEFLGVRILLLVTGLCTLFRRHRRLLGWILAWTIPYAETTVQFRIEGQHDFWFVASWFPLILAEAAGLDRIARAAGNWSKRVAAAAGLAGVVWAAAANFPDVSQRDYRLAEIFGRLHLEPLDRDAILLVSSDEAAATCLYLQTVRGLRPDVLIVRPAHLEHEGQLSWYDRILLRRVPALRPPDYATVRRRHPRGSGYGPFAGAFIRANSRLERPVFMTFTLPDEELGDGFTLVPAGALWKRVPQSEAMIDRRHWETPITPEEILPRLRRKRDQRIKPGRLETGLVLEAYETRLFELLLRARINLARWNLSQGNAAETEELAKSILAADPRKDNMEALHILAMALFELGRMDRAEPLFLRTAAQEDRLVDRAEALTRLGQIHRSRGEENSARECFRQALAIPGLEPTLREKIRRLSAPRE